MANYEAEYKFVFNLKKNGHFLKRGLQIGLFLQIIVCVYILYFTSFYTISGEPIDRKITIKYFAAYVYPDNPKSSVEALDVEPQLRQYASAFDSRISEETLQLPGNWYQALANFSSGGTYEHLSTMLKCSFFSYVFSVLYIWYFVDKAKAVRQQEYTRSSKTISQK